MAKSLRVLSSDGFITRGRELTWEEVDQNFIDLKTDTDNLLPDPTGNNNKILFVSGDSYVLKDGGNTSSVGGVGYIQLSDGSGNLISGDTLFFDTANKTLVINDTGGIANTSFIVKGQGNNSSTTNFLIKNSTNNNLLSVLDNGTVNMSTQSGALLPPRLTNSQRNNIIPPQNGMIIYNVDAGEFQGYNNGWNALGSGSGVPTLTPGSITFGGTGGILSEDNNNLFFNNTTKRVGIGTNTPVSTLEIASTGTTNSTLSLSIKNNNNNNLFSIADDGTINFNSGITTIEDINFNNSNILDVTNLVIGSSTLAANSDHTITMINGSTTPTSPSTDTFLMYASDSGIANSSPFFLTENNTVIDLYKLYIAQPTTGNVQTLTVPNSTPTTPLTINEQTTVVEITLEGNWTPSSITGFIENKKIKFKFFTNGLNPFPWQVTFPADIQRNDGVEPLLVQNTDSSLTGNYDYLELLGKETTSKAQILNSVTYG